MSNQIFLSYSRKNLNFALKIAADLKNKGINVWMDKLDGIRSGMEWRKTLEIALDECVSMICIISSDYIISKYCRRELGRADSLGKNIYPIIFEHVDQSKFPLELEGIQYEDFTGSLDPQVYEQKLHSIEKEILKTHDQSISIEVNNIHQYLNSLLANLNSKKGVIEFVEMESETEFRPRLNTEEEDLGFSELMVGLEEKNATKKTFENLNFANEYPKLILLGEPGSGKTTTLRKIAKELTIQKLNNKSQLIPIYLQLSEWNSDQEQFSNFVTNQLSSKKINLDVIPDSILLLDGIDEIGGDKFKKIASMNNWLKSNAAPNYYIGTCRTSDFFSFQKINEKLFENIPPIFLKPLSTEKVHELVKNHFKEDAGNSFFSKFNLEKIKNNPYAFKSWSGHHGYKKYLERKSENSLLNNPFMLYALIFLKKHNALDSLFNSGANIIDKLVRALWKRENKKNKDSKKSFEEILEVLSNVAFFMTEINMVTISNTEVIKIGLDENLLRSGFIRNMIDETNGNIRFKHLLIQDYFTAINLLRKNEITEVIEPIQTKSGPNYVYLTSTYEQKFYHALKFAFHLSKSPNQILAKIIKINPFLARELAHLKNETYENNDAQIIESLSFNTISLLSELDKIQKNIDANKGTSGMWDDIEDSISDCRIELKQYFRKCIDIPLAKQLFMNSTQINEEFKQFIERK